MLTFFVCIFYCIGPESVCNFSELVREGKCPCLLSVSFTDVRKETPYDFTKRLSPFSGISQLRNFCKVALTNIFSAH